MRYYLSIEKNIEVFELFKTLWHSRGIIGIRADNMTEGIKKAIEIEKSKTDELYFIDIVADDIDYMAQLKILSEETNAPILIATSKPDDSEHHEALNNGADFYGGYCDDVEQNIEAVISVINSIDRRARKPRPPSKLLVHKNLLMSPLERVVYLNGKRIDLTFQEFDLLHYLLQNSGLTLTHNQIYRRVWKGRYDDSTKNVLWDAIKRLRKKLSYASDEDDYIVTVRNIGYRVSPED